MASPAGLEPATP